MHLDLKYMLVFLWQIKEQPLTKHEAFIQQIITKVKVVLVENNFAVG